MAVQLLIRRGVLKGISKEQFSRSWLKKKAVLLLEILEISEAELSILITDDKEISDLNRRFRHKDKPTDVLSFPSVGSDGVDEELEHLQGMLGDLVISLPTALRQSRAYRHSLQAELLRLLVHGLLHLLGYDHEGVAKIEAQRMRRKEKELLSKLS